MNPLAWVKLGGAVAVAILVAFAFNTVLGWREDAAELPKVQADFDAYRSDIEAQAQERARREAIDREIEQTYQSTIREQGEALAAARHQLRGVRLRLGACAAVPAADGSPAATASADAAGADGLPDNLAEMAGDRFAQCDAIAARLNALIDWQRRTRP